MQTGQANQGITLNSKQSQTLIDFYQTQGAKEYTESILNIYQGYIMSSNDDLGQIPTEQLEKDFYVVSQLIKLVLAIEPENVFQLQKVG